MPFFLCASFLELAPPCRPGERCFIVDLALCVLVDVTLRVCSALPFCCSRGPFLSYYIFLFSAFMFLFRFIFVGVYGLAVAEAVPFLLDASLSVTMFLVVFGRFLPTRGRCRGPSLSCVWLFRSVYVCFLFLLHFFLLCCCSVLPSPPRRLLSALTALPSLFFCFFLRACTCFPVASLGCCFYGFHGTSRIVCTSLSLFVLVFVSRAFTTFRDSCFCTCMVFRRRRLQPVFGQRVTRSFWVVCASYI